MPRSLLILMLAGAVAIAQDPAYETPPILRASEVLKPEFVAGTSYRVLDNVTTWAGRNRYTIETPWGYFHADGDQLLMARIAEAKALTEMESVSKTEEFKKGLKQAAKTPLNAGRELLDDPKSAIKGTAKGLWKFVNRTGESIKRAANDERGQGEDSAAKQLLGVSKAKRALALQLGVDPYSSNEVLQEQLDSFAWVATAGAGTFKLATLPIGGGAGIALSATQVTENFKQSLRDLSPGDLQISNKRKLLAMGVSDEIADAFLANPAFSPTNQTAFVSALDALEGVKNRSAFVSIAADTASEEGDALFCSGTAQLLAALHSGNDKLDRIAMLNGLPAAIAADGRLIIALQWDTAFWSARTEHFVESAATAKLGQSGPVVVAITGNATPRVKTELDKKGIALVTHILPGPQR